MNDYPLRLLFLFFPCLLIISSGLFAEPIFWPTNNSAYQQNKGLEKFIQPTSTGRIHSGLFGCVRNDGWKFHEGIDIKATEHDKSGEALDKVFSALPGIVSYINKTAGYSAYGRYLIMEHPTINPPIYSLYAHLRSINDDVKVGDFIKGGTHIARMGRSSSGYTIPKSRAHLHFELGFQLTQNFQPWYDKKRYKTKNQHGIWNGMNLVAFNALDYFDSRKNQKVSSIFEYLQKESEAFRLRIHTQKIPSFIKRYPTLLKANIQKEHLQGWDVSFTWYGLPLGWMPYHNKEKVTTTGSPIEILKINKPLLQKSLCRKTIILHQKSASVGPVLKNYLELLFDFNLSK